VITVRAIFFRGPKIQTNLPTSGFLTSPIKFMNIAIIGAGIAGLACAQRLLQQGHAVSVFEKSRGPSGRASTRRTDTWQADHGAQYFTARTQDFCDQVHAWMAMGAVSQWQGRIRVLQDQLLIPSESVVRYVGTPHMTAPAREMAVGLPVATGVTVTSLRQQGQQSQQGHQGHLWQLHSQEHGWHDPGYDFLVFAIPQPQLAPFAPYLCDGINQSMAAVQFQPCHAVMLQYESPLDLGFDGLFVNDQQVGWVSRNSSKPGRTGQESWVVHMSASFSQAFLEAPQDQVIAAAEQFMQSRGAPLSVAATLHRWRYALAKPSLDTGYLIDHQQRIAICGDWLSGGRIEGAWLSGRKAAQAICES
jgi:renalase